METVLFDFGGVILDIDFAASYRAFARILGADPAALAADPRLAGPIRDLELGALPDDLFRRGVQSSFGASLPDADFDEAWNAMLLGYNTAAIELLGELRGRYRLCLLSNTNAIHYRRYDAMHRELYGAPLASRFDRLFLSHQMRLAKPSPEIYRRVAADLACDPASILFVDDLLSNVEAARAAGMRGAHLPRNREIRDVVMRHLGLDSGAL